VNKSMHSLYPRSLDLVLTTLTLWHLSGCSLVEEEVLTLRETVRILAAERDDALHTATSRHHVRTTSPTRARRRVWWARSPPPERCACAHFHFHFDQLLTVTSNLLLLFAQLEMEKLETTMRNLTTRAFLSQQEAVSQSLEFEFGGPRGVDAPSHTCARWCRDLCSCV
jgi:hypothetical protein